MGPASQFQPDNDDPLRDIAPGGIDPAVQMQQEQADIQAAIAASVKEQNPPAQQELPPISAKVEGNPDLPDFDEL